MEKFVVLFVLKDSFFLQAPLQQVTTPTQYSLQGFSGAPQGLSLSLPPAGHAHTVAVGPSQSTLNKAAPPFKPAQSQHSGSIVGQVKSPPQCGTPTSGFGGQVTPTHSPSTKFGIPGQYQQQQPHPLALTANTFQIQQASHQQQNQPMQHQTQQQPQQPSQHKGFGNSLQKANNQQQPQQQQQYQPKVNATFVGQPIQPSGVFTLILLPVTSPHKTCVFPEAKACSCKTLQAKACSVLQSAVILS